MGSTRDVKDRIPGLQFRLESKQSLPKKTASGTFHGFIHLACEYKDVKLFEAAAEKLNGFKVFSDLSEEIVDAISEELDNTDKDLKAALIENENLTATILEKNAEIARLNGLLQVIDRDLDDLQGEAVFNDRD